MTTTSTTLKARSGVTMLGLGAMGSALAGRLVEAGHPVTVWNRSSGRDAALVERGATPAASVTEAITAQPIVVTCLLQHPSVREVLTPAVDALRGRTLVNFTTTTPNEARELHAWARKHDVDYLDGAILAVPVMIGSRQAQIYCSGSQAAYEQHRDIFDAWATSTYEGPDAGMASLIDLAMLSAMYQMVAGFLHGAAMVGSEGMTVTEFAARTAPFLSAMTNGFASYATVIDGGDYTIAGQQSLEFSDLSPIVRTSSEQGVNPATIMAVEALISREIEAGHGSEGLARIYESLRRA